MFQYALGRHISIRNNEKLKLDLSGLNSSKEKNTTKRDCDLLNLSVDAHELKDSSVDFSYTITGLMKFYIKKIFGKFPYSIIQER